MSHPASLIARIVALLEHDYPKAFGYTYVLERAIPGTRFCPDVQVWSSGVLVCAVEVGYTRPEKLTAYRDILRIPDVRWYDKEGQRHGDVSVRSVNLSVRLREPEGPLYAYLVYHEVPCHDADCIGAEPPEALCDGEPLTPAEQEASFNEAYEDVQSLLITDYVRWWVVSCCDKCGAIWQLDEDIYADLGLDELPRELAARFGARTRLASWSAACALVRNYFGDVEFDHARGGFADFESEMSFRNLLRVSTDAARSDAAMAN